MKKQMLMLLCLLAVAISGCAQSQTASRNQGSQGKSVGEVLEEGIEREETTELVSMESDTVAPSAEEIETASIESFPLEASLLETMEEVPAAQVDLTSLSSTLVYSEVYQMLSTPEEYLGKTIKMKGLYNPVYDEELGEMYHLCLIADATACCAQGLEFALTDGIYPEPGQECIVLGTYDLYQEGEYYYCILRDAKLL